MFAIGSRVCRFQDCHYCPYVSFKAKDVADKAEHQLSNCLVLPPYLSFQTMLRKLHVANTAGHTFSSKKKCQNLDFKGGRWKHRHKDTKCLTNLHSFSLCIGLRASVCNQSYTNVLARCPIVLNVPKSTSGISPKISVVFFMSEIMRLPFEFVLSVLNFLQLIVIKQVRNSKTQNYGTKCE